MAAATLAWCAACAGPESLAQPPASEAVAEDTRPTDAEGAIAVELPGVLLPTHRLTLTAPVPGVLEWVGVELGERVTRGQPLARVSAPALQAALDAEQAGLEAARVGVSKAEAARLVAEEELEVVEGLGPYVPEVELRYARQGLQRAAFEAELARSRLHEQQAIVAQLSAPLSAAALTAPFDGVVAMRLREPGERVSEGDPILVVGTDRQRVRFAFSPTEVTLSPGDALRVEALDGETSLPATVRSVSPWLDSAAGLVLAEADIDVETASALASGSQVRVRLALERSGG